MAFTPSDAVFVLSEGVILLSILTGCLIDIAHQSPLLSSIVEKIESAIITMEKEVQRWN